MRPNPFGNKQSHQVVENTAGVSGIGQNKANFGAGPSTVDAARPKVQELLEQMQSDPAARAMVETFLLQQMVAEESRREEVEVATLQREKEKRTALEDELEQMVAAQQALERKNRRLRAEAATSEVAHQQFREQIRPAEAAVPERHEPTREEIFCKISEVIGVGQPPSYRVESEVEGMPGYHLTQQEYWDFQHGCGPAWEEEQRRKAAGAARQQAPAPEEELYSPH